MLKNLKKRNQGFTIVETLIVLAIAGLIILIVLLAVPALQRSSRNSNMKSDTSALAGAVNQYESNNNGVPPTYFSGSGPAIAVGTSATDANAEKAKVQGSTTVVTESSGTANTATAPTPGEIDVYLKQTCAGATSNRATALVFSTESASNKQVQCLDT